MRVPANYEPILAFSALGIGLWLAISQPEKWNKLVSIATPWWIANALILCTFSAFVLTIEKSNNSLSTAVKRGIMALIIALFGEIGLTIAPFWTVFAVSYFMESWI